MDEQVPDPMETRKYMEAAMKNYAANKEIYEMAVNQQAEMIQTSYRALIGAGFTETQALEIIKARGAAL